MRKLVSAMLGAVVVLGSGSALAQEQFSSKGDAVFGADRLFSIHSTHLAVDVPQGPGATVTYDTTYTGFGFGWNGNGTDHVSPYDIPRFGFDYFLFDHFSLGGELGYATTSWDDPGRNGRSRSDAAFLLSPRVGYVWMFSDAIGFWLRGGLTYHSYAYSNWNNDENGLGLTAEGMFVFIPTGNFGFQAGPTFDIDLFGSYKDDAGNKYDVHYRTIGLQFGLFGWI